MTKFNNIVGLALILGLLHACGSKPNPEKEEAYQKAAEKFVADESFFPILDEELFYFNSQRVDTIENCSSRRRGWPSPLATIPPRRRRAFRTISSCHVPSPLPMMDFPSSSTTPIPTVASPSRTLHVYCAERLPNGVRFTPTPNWALLMSFSTIRCQVLYAGVWIPSSEGKSLQTQTSEL